MLKPFIWMFKEQQFYKDYTKLLIINIVIVLLAFGMYFFSSYFSDTNFLLPILIKFLIIILLLGNILCNLGYFWELTSGIIHRTTEIYANNVFNGKIKEKYKYNFPEKFNIKNFIWRGFASIVATILLTGAYAYLFLSDNFKTSFVGVTAIVVMCFLSLFIPALLWNYARLNSIFSVWNIFKAKYVFQNYTFTYLKNIIVAILFASIDFGLIYIIFNLIKNININFIEPSFVDISFILLITVVVLIKFIYNIFVYAYLLGTIAPSAEA